MTMPPHPAEQQFQPTIPQPIQPPSKMQHSQEQQQRSAWQTIPPIGTDRPIQMSIPPQPEAQPQQQPQFTTVERERRGWQQVAVPKPAPIPPAVGKNTTGSNVAAKQAEPKKQQQKGAKAKGGGNQQVN